MNLTDQFILALTAWRENRSGGRTGMQSVMNVILNRAEKRGTCAYMESTRPLQFSSITAPNDPQLRNWPTVLDPAWQVAQALAQTAADGELADITDGATNYYALTIPEPSWAAAMTRTVEIEGQVFFK